MLGQNARAYGPGRASSQSDRAGRRGRRTGRPTPAMNDGNKLRPSKRCAGSRRRRWKEDSGHTDDLDLCAQNDTYFRPEIAQSLYKAFTASGGKAEYHAVGPNDDEGHYSGGRAADRRFGDRWSSATSRSAARSRRMKNRDQSVAHTTASMRQTLPDFWSANTNWPDSFAGLPLIFDISVAGKTT